MKPDFDEQYTHYRRQRAAWNRKDPDEDIPLDVQQKVGSTSFPVLLFTLVYVSCWQRLSVKDAYLYITQTVEFWWAYRRNRRLFRKLHGLKK